jgi:hypothetical protein
VEPIKKLLVRFKQAVLTVAIVAIAGLVALAIVIHSKNQPGSGIEQLNKVTSAVSKHIILPKNETPTLATVQDISKLRQQAIFTNAQNGDKILVYPKAQEIFVYRPSADKLVAVGPLVLDKHGSPYITAKIAILDGSGQTQALAKMTESVVSVFPNATIVAKDQAPRLFPQSIAVDLTKASQTLDEQIADTLGIKAGQLPLGITPPAGAEFLIFIGQQT